MSKVSGKDAAVYIKQYDISGEGNRVSLAYAIDAVESTGFQAPAKEYVEGNYAWTVGIDGFWTNAGQASSAVFGLIGAGTQIISIFPEGKSAGKVGYEGWGILTSYNPEATIGGAVVFSADLQGDDILNRATMLESGIKTTGGTDVFSTARNIGTAGLNRGITAVCRAVSGAHGTCDVKIQASTAEVLGWGDIFSFTQLTGGAAVELKNVATAGVGPWFRAFHRISGAGDSFDLTVSCATEE